MANRSWPEERAEIAVWLSGFLGIYKKWVDKILDNDDVEVNKNKIIELLDEWIGKLEEMKIKIIKMPDTPKQEINDI
jgi:hypothetical protein|tara:strand:+ start:499 stop:729 length:231 start_codon:yes stop_codon:yes gene_type:complete